MTKKAFRWCPNKCGKKVICTFERMPSSSNRIYQCTKCDNFFSKNELEAYE